MGSEPSVDQTAARVPTCPNITLSFLPIYNLRQGHATAMLCWPADPASVPSVPAAGYLQGCDLEDRDLLDEAVLDQSIFLVRHLHREQLDKSVVISVSFRTLNRARSRLRYQCALERADEQGKRALILKIDDLPAGISVTHLIEIVAAVRPYVHHVILHLSGLETQLTQSRFIGATGLAVTIPPNAPHPDVFRLSSWLVRTAATQNAISCVDGVDMPRLRNLLSAAGVRFAAGCVGEHCIQPRDSSPEAFVAAVLENSHPLASSH